MASWLKVAEDLLEVVDRRAKLVVSELADEQSESQPSASNGQEGKSRRTKLKEKGQSRQSSSTTKNSNVEQEKKSLQSSAAPDVKVDRDETHPSETSLDVGTNHTEEVSAEHLFVSNNDTVISDVAPSVVAHTDKSGTDVDIEVAVPITENDTKTTSSTTKDDINKNLENMLESSSTALMDKQSEVTNNDHPADANPNISSVDEATSLKVDQVSPESDTVERRAISNGQEKESGSLEEPSPNMNKQQEHNTGTTSVKVQDQLDEAQALLKTAVSTGQSKEARLTRVCAGLSSRLQEYKSENAQLEELLVSERERVISYEARMKQLQQDLSASKLEVARAESNE